MDRITNNYVFPGDDTPNDVDDAADRLLSRAPAEDPTISGNVITTAERGFQNVTVDGSSEILP